MKCTQVEFTELSKEILAKSACFRFQAKGKSMFPAIRDGDILNVELVNDQKIRLGDVIFYRASDERMVAHRVIKRIFKSNKLILITKGDSNTDRGQEVNLEDILGRVKVIERGRHRINVAVGFGRLINVFYGKASLLIIILKQIGSSLLRFVQGFQVYRQLTRRFFKKQVLYQVESSGNSGNCFLAKRNNMVIGRAELHNFLGSDSHYQGWWIFGMWVNWRYRRLGIGEQLTKKACDLADQAGASEVKLLVFQDSKPAINLYRKLGFRRISIPEIDKELKEEAGKTSQKRIIMEKNIQGEKVNI